MNKITQSIPSFPDVGEIPDVTKHQDIKITIWIVLVVILVALIIYFFKKK